MDESQKASLRLSFEFLEPYKRLLLENDIVVGKYRFRNIFWETRDGKLETNLAGTASVTVPPLFTIIFII